MDVEKTIEFLLEQGSAYEARAARAQEEMAEIRAIVRGVAEQGSRTEATLRRAIRLSVQEHRRERVRRRALQEQMPQLAVSQALTKESLRTFIDSLKQPRNGHDNV